MLSPALLAKAKENEQIYADQLALAKTALEEAKRDVDVLTELRANAAGHVLLIEGFMKKYLGRDRSTEGAGD